MIVIDTYTAIDMDRTILKSTTLFYSYIIPELRRTYELDESIIKRVQNQETEMRGRAFDFVAYLNDILKQEYRFRVSIDDLADRIIKQQTDVSGVIKNDFIKAILVDGTFELLSALKSRHAERWGLMTSGGFLTQSLKCKIVAAIVKQQLGAELSWQIISGENKSQMIATEWYDATKDMFHLPAVLNDDSDIYTKSIRVIDDKPHNLLIEDRMSIDVKGKMEFYLVRPSETAINDGYTLTEVTNLIRNTR